MGLIGTLGTASRNEAATSRWCGHCGMALPAAHGSGSGVRCAFCYRVTVPEAASLPRPSPPVLPGLVQIPAGYPYPRVSGGYGKRALLVGVSYMGTKRELRGTVSAVKEMRNLLCDSFGFPSACILELTEKESAPSRVPTRENLLLAMRWLVEGTGAGDSLVFHFSGHGVQMLEMNVDEVVGYNEALCPVDFERSGMILDEEINEIIVRPLGAAVKLHAIVDTSHSRTILDLRYRCRMFRTGYWQWEKHTRPSGMLTERSTNGGLAISISGGSDNDASGFSDESSSISALTDSFIKALEAEPGTTYGRLLRAMRTRIRDGQGSLRLPGRLGSFVRRIIPSSGVQEPQLCSSEEFDIYRKPFLL